MLLIVWRQTSKFSSCRDPVHIPWKWRNTYNSCLTPPE